jgi:hypothetical protein
VFYAYFDAMRRTPNAMVTVVTATKPSGITDTAKLYRKMNKTHVHKDGKPFYLRPTLIMVLISFFHAIPMTTTSAQRKMASTTR